MIELYELALLGFFVSFLIGLSGMGGGALLMPVLVLCLHLPAPVAVGSSLLFSFFVKVYGSFYHYKQTNINFSLIRNLSLGSIPGSLFGVLLLQAFKGHGASAADSVIMKTTGVVLVVIPFIILMRFVLGITLHEKYHGSFRFPETNKLAGFLVGVTGGILVGLTSVGGGTIIIMLLLLFFSLDSSELVGTDIIHSAILTLFAATLHMISGHVDFPLVGKLLIGAIPGIYLGCHSCYYLPNRFTKMVINIGLMGMGINILVS